MIKYSTKNKIIISFTYLSILLGASANNLASAQNSIYKCTEDGRISYQSQPCSNDDNSTTKDESSVLRDKDIETYQTNKNSCDELDKIAHEIAVTKKQLETTTKLSRQVHENEYSEKVSQILRSDKLTTKQKLEYLKAVENDKKAGVIVDTGDLDAKLLRLSLEETIASLNCPR